MENDPRLRRWFWIVLALASAWKVYAICALTLCYDESYYHYWSLHPQLSYFDHPPMTAWLMTVSGALFGNSVWTVRIWPLIFSTLVTLIGRTTAREMFDAQAGDRAGIMLAVAPIFLGNGVVMTPDVPLSLFWVAAIYCAWRALSEPGFSFKWWLLVGVTAGLGFLSKYNMVIFYFGLILFFIVSPTDRKRVFQGCWLSGIVAVLIFSPVLIWNVQNDFASFRFQLNRRMMPGAHHSALQNFGEYAGVLIGIVTPVLAVLCFRSSARSIFSADRARKFCAVFFWSVVLLFAYSAFKTRIQANWPMMAFATALYVVAADLPLLARWVRVSAWSVLGGMTGAVVLLSFSLSFFTPYPRVREFTQTPWMAKAIAEKKDTEKLDFVCTSSHELFGVASFYAPALRDELWFPASGRIRFPWIDEKHFAGKSALLVNDHKEWGKAPYFERIEPLGSASPPSPNALQNVPLYFWKGVKYAVPK